MRLRLLTTICMACALLLSAACGAHATSWFTLSDPVDPGQLTELPFGARSDWLQPWRSSLVTRPATALQNAIGINFNVTPAEADATAQLLADSGVRRARLEVGWSNMSYADPSQLSDPSALREYLTAFRTHGLRPLIVLNANSGMPGPGRTFDLNLTASAPQGATTLDLGALSAAQVVPGLTGINAADQAGYPMAAGVLITSVDSNGVATLSRPLPTSLAAGPVAATTLRYPPFAHPYLANGSPNPRFEQTLAGWLTYVKSVCQFVRDAYGSDNFDVEVWNEMTFGSAFLDESNYYSPVPDPGSTGDVDNALLARTIQMLQNPANALTDVKVGDGFANEVPWVSGATVPAGTAAIDHHPYSNAVTFPQGAIINTDPPVDALGRRSYSTTRTGAYQDLFVPHFTSFFPEYYLNGIQTETLMRDLSPIQNDLYGTPHGAGTHPAGAAPPANWITETNLDATQATTLGVPPADIPEFQAKAALRFYLSYASEGMQAIDLYAAGCGCGDQLIPQSFLDTVDAAPTAYPGDNLGGLSMQAVSRMVSAFAGAQQIAQPRQLTLDAIASDNNTDVQFTGDGTPAHPTLHNRDVLAFFPFQVNPYKFVSAVYVMTRDLAQYYTSAPAPGQTPYDLPPENFRLTIGNVNGARATVSLTDPLTGTSQAATIVSRSTSQIVVQLQATDAPRLLTIDDAPAEGQTATVPLPQTTVVTAPVGAQINLNISGAAPGVVSLAATPANGHARRAVVAARRQRLGAKGRHRVTLKLTPRTRAWLKSNKVTRVRIVVRGRAASARSRLVASVVVDRRRRPRTRRRQ